MLPPGLSFEKSKKSFRYCKIGKNFYDELQQISLEE